MTKLAREDTGMLQAALIGYHRQLDEIQIKMREVRRRLGQRDSTPVSTSSGNGESHQPKRHKISAAGRARIAAAQKKRWAAQKRTEKAMAAG